jgi:pimeloyl-ACP methyl ester carboxylesterase
MTKKGVNDLNTGETWGQSPGLPTSAGSYAALCSFELLQRAYEEVRKNFGQDGIDLETADSEAVQDVLKHLSRDLEARTYHPTATASVDPSTDLLEGSNRACIADQVVQFALKLVLDGLFKQTIPCDLDPEEAVNWLGGVIEKGLTRAYIVTLEGSLEDLYNDQLLQQVSQRIEDSDIVGLLDKIRESWLVRETTASTAPTPAGRTSEASGVLARPKATVWASLAFAGIDEILQQANAIGRHETFSLVKTARFGDHIMVLCSPDASLDWVLPAVERRLREELQRLAVGVNAAKTQFVNLARGDVLRLLGFELRCVPGKGGVLSARYHRVEKAPRPKAKEPQQESRKPTPPRRVPRTLQHLNWRSNRARWVYGAIVLALIEVGLFAWVFWPSGGNDPLRYEHFVRPSGDRVNYAMYVPAAYQSTQRYPLIVFLHGDAGVPTLEGKIEHFPGIHLAIRLATQRGEPFDFIVLFPVARQGSWAPGSDDSRLVIELVDEVCKKFSVDRDRIYLTGFAAGGTGVWNLAAEYPDRWAAIVPVSGTPSPDLAARVAHLPCWCFQGEYGGIEAVRGMMKAVGDAGGKPRCTEVRGRGSDIWNQAYLNKELYAWLAGQRRGG